MSTLGAKVQQVFDEPGCATNQAKPTKERKKGCNKMLAPGAAAHYRCSPLDSWPNWMRRSLLG